MKSFVIPLRIAFCSLAGIRPVGAAEGLSQPAYYDAALQRSEMTAIQVQQIQQAEERYRQASAALRPTVSGAVDYT